MLPQKPKKNLSSSSETKVIITLVSKELEWFFLGFFGVEFDFQSIEIMYSSVVGTILGVQWA